MRRLFEIFVVIAIMTKINLNDSSIAIHGINIYEVCIQTVGHSFRDYPYQ